MDWGLGRYEHIALGLQPAAATLVDLAAPISGERVVDIGCGTGSAALIAATRGTSVIGVDPAERLVGVARDRAFDHHLRAAFVCGEVQSLPLADDAVDIVLSAFGVIFAPDAKVAAQEMARVAAPASRIVLSAWVPEGALFELSKVRRESLVAVGAGSSGAPPFSWNDATALDGLFGPLGFSVEVHEKGLTFVAQSPEAFLETELSHHPLWIAAHDVLAPRRRWSSVQQRALGVVSNANEDPAAFRITSRYVIAVLRRGGPRAKDTGSSKVGPQTVP